MRKSILTVIIAVLAVFGSIAKAQNNVYDIITLKDGKGIVKGFINEQVLGQSIKIIPDEAILQIDYKDIAGVPTKKSIKTDSTTVETDVVVLKNGQTIEGKIVERAPDKWIVISASKLPEQTYPLESIEKIGKGISGSKNDIFNEYGVLDVLITKDGTVSKGIIIEQTFGKTVKIKTPDKSILVYDIEDIATVSREAYDPSKDIFKQSAFLDILQLKNGSLIKGIIIQQTPGEQINIETVGNSRFVQKYTDVVKLIKEKNPDKEELDKPVVVEPEFIGDCFWIKDSVPDKLLEKQEYTRSRKTPSLLFINGKDTSNVRIPAESEIKFIVRVTNNDLSPLQQIYIFQLGIDKRTKQRSIDTTRYPFLNPKAKGKTLRLVSYTFTKIGNSSFEISFKLKEAGEYAVYVTGCDKTFSLFGVDTKNNSK